MDKEEVHIDPLSLTFQVEGNERNILIPKSQLHIHYVEQLDLITQETDYMVPLTIEEEDDAYRFSFYIDPDLLTWEDVKKRNKNDKLRALCNLEKLHRLSTRITMFFHPNNIFFDENLMPKVMYRGIRGLVVPTEMNEADILKQYKCLSVVLFSDTYSFDHLYQGSLDKVEQSFDKQIKQQESIEALFSFLRENYRKEQLQMDSKMKLVPRKQFRLYKQATIWVSVIAVLILALLVYTVFMKIPFQEKQLEAQHEFLANDYGKVIHTLQKEAVDKIPFESKYVLAYSYLQVEQLSDDEKEAIMKNINLKSDTAYLKYWIYNGRGDFDESLDLSKYMDDPQLIMYSLIKKIEQVKNDPELSGTEREEEINTLNDQLEKYTEEYDLLDEEAEDEQPVEEEDIETDKAREDEEEKAMKDAKDDASKEKDAKQADKEKKPNKKKK